MSWIKSYFAHQRSWVIVVEPFFGLNGDLDDWNLGPKISTKLGQREAGKIRNFFDHDTSWQPAPARLDHDANQQTVN